MARFTEGSQNIRLEGIAAPVEGTDATNMTYVDSQISGIQGNVTVFSSTTDYTEGSLVISSNRLFRANGDIAASATTPETNLGTGAAQWTEISSDSDTSGQIRTSNFQVASNSLVSFEKPVLEAGQTERTTVIGKRSNKFLSTNVGASIEFRGPTGTLIFDPSNPLAQRTAEDLLFHDAYNGSVFVQFYRPDVAEVGFAELAVQTNIDLNTTSRFDILGFYLTPEGSPPMLNVTVIEFPDGTALELTEIINVTKTIQDLVPLQGDVPTSWDNLLQTSRARHGITISDDGYIENDETADAVVNNTLTVTGPVIGTVTHGTAEVAAFTGATIAATHDDILAISSSGHLQATQTITIPESTIELDVASFSGFAPNNNSFTVTVNGTVVGHNYNEPLQELTATVPETTVAENEELDVVIDIQDPGRSVTFDAPVWNIPVGVRRHFYAANSITDREYPDAIALPRARTAVSLSDDGDTLTYTDSGGTVRTFSPAGDPGVLEYSPTTAYAVDDFMYTTRGTTGVDFGNVRGTNRSSTARRDYILWRKVSTAGAGTAPRPGTFADLTEANVTAGTALNIITLTAGSGDIPANYVQDWQIEVNNRDFIFPWQPGQEYRETPPTDNGVLTFDGDDLLSGLGTFRVLYEGLAYQTVENFPTGETNIDRQPDVSPEFWRVSAEANVQADWDETDTSSDAYIVNKPFDSVDTTGVLNINNGVLSTDAEVNVQADWNETDTTSDAFIRNKIAYGLLVEDFLDPDNRTPAVYSNVNFQESRRESNVLIAILANQFLGTSLNTTLDAAARNLAGIQDEQAYYLQTIVTTLSTTPTLPEGSQLWFDETMYVWSSNYPLVSGTTVNLMPGRSGSNWRVAAGSPTIYDQSTPLNGAAGNENVSQLRFVGDSVSTSRSGITDTVSVAINTHDYVDGVVRDQVNALRHELSDTLVDRSLDTEDHAPVWRVANHPNTCRRIPTFDLLAVGNDEDIVTFSNDRRLAAKGYALFKINLVKGQTAFTGETRFIENGGIVGGGNGVPTVDSNGEPVDYISVAAGSDPISINSSGGQGLRAYVPGQTLGGSGRAWMISGGSTPADNSVDAIIARIQGLDADEYNHNEDVSGQDKIVLNPANREYIIDSFEVTPTSTRGVVSGHLFDPAVESGSFNVALFASDIYGPSYFNETLLTFLNNAEETGSLPTVGGTIFNPVNSDTGNGLPVSTPINVSTGEVFVLVEPALNGRAMTGGRPDFTGPASIRHVWYAKSDASITWGSANSADNIDSILTDIAAVSPEWVQLSETLNEPFEEINTLDISSARYALPTFSNGIRQPLDSSNTALQSYYFPGVDDALGENLVDRPEDYHILMNTGVTAPSQVFFRVNSFDNGAKIATGYLEGEPTQHTSGNNLTKIAPTRHSSLLRTSTAADAGDTVRIIFEGSAAQTHFVVNLTETVDGVSSAAINIPITTVAGRQPAPQIATAVANALRSRPNIFSATVEGGAVVIHYNAGVAGSISYNAAATTLNGLRITVERTPGVGFIGRVEDTSRRRLGIGTGTINVPTLNVGLNPATAYDGVNWWMPLRVYEHDGRFFQMVYRELPAGNSLGPFLGSDEDSTYARAFSGYELNNHVGVLTDIDFATTNPETNAVIVGLVNHIGSANLFRTTGPATLIDSIDALPASPAKTLLQTQFTLLWREITGDELPDFAQYRSDGVNNFLEIREQDRRERIVDATRLRGDNIADASPGQSDSLVWEENNYVRTPLFGETTGVVLATQAQVDLTNRVNGNTAISAGDSVIVVPSWIPSDSSIVSAPTDLATSPSDRGSALPFGMFGLTELFLGLQQIPTGQTDTAETYREVYWRRGTAFYWYPNRTIDVPDPRTSDPTDTVTLTGVWQSYEGDSTPTGTQWRVPYEG